MSKRDSDEFDNIIELLDENGKTVRFEFLDLVEYGSEEYVVLLPTDENDSEVVILRVDDSGDGDEEAYSSVDDDATLDAVYSIFKERFRDVFTFNDD